MKLPWFGKKSASFPVASGYRAWTVDGVAVVWDRQHLAHLSVETGQPLAAPDLSGLLEQLEDEGFALPIEGGMLIPWEQIYALQANPAFATSLPPSRDQCQPCSEIAPLPGRSAVRHHGERLA